MAPHKIFQHYILHKVGILILINEDVLINILILLAKIRIVVQQQKHIDQQVIKIHRVLTLHIQRVLLVDSSPQRHITLRIRFQRPRIRHVVLCQYNLVLTRRNELRNPLWLIHRAIGHIHIAHHPPQQPEARRGIPNRKTFAVPSTRHFTTKNLQKNRMERPRAHHRSLILPHY